MAKPSTLPSWATDPSAEVVPPSAEKQAIGFKGKEEPPAGFLNWPLYWICQWLAYLSTGAFDGDISATGTVSATDYKLTGGATQDLNLVTPKVSGCTASEYAVGFGTSPGIRATATTWAWFSWSITNQLRSGDRLKSINLLFTHRSSTTVTIDLVSYDTGTDTATTLQTWTDSTTGAHSFSATVTSPPTLAVGQKLYVHIYNDSTGSSDDVINRIYIGYDHP